MRSSTRRMTRRDLLRRSLVIAGCPCLASWGQSLLLAAENKRERFFFGVHPYSIKSLFDSGELSLEGYPAFAKNSLGVQAIELAAELSLPLLEKPDLVARIRKSAESQGIKVHALLCSDAFKLDAIREADRKAAVEDHLRWAAIASQLGCTFLRVRASTAGHLPQQLQNAADGIGSLCDQLPKGSPAILIENVAGPSRNADWMVDLVKKIGVDRVGFLADFGNFDGDLYTGMAKLMPFTKSVCTKSWDFDADGNDTKIDFGKMMQIVLSSDFSGCISIEYLGKKALPIEGVKKTIELVQRHLAK